MRRLDIRIDPDELIVGNRTTGVRGGVVFPEAGISWIDRELDTMATRPQDKFNVHPEDAATFRERILPYWQGKTLEDTLRAEDGPLLDAIARVVKINQKDHAQGHICPDTAKWIRLGPAGIRAEAAMRAASATPDQREFYDSVLVVLDASMDFMRRYADLATDMAVTAETPERVANLREVARICNKLSVRRRRDLPRGGPVPLVPVHSAPHGEQRLVVLAGPRRPVPLPLLPGGRRRRPAGPGRCPRAHRGALAQVQPDRLPAELAQRVVLRRFPDRLQRRVRRP